MKHKLNPFLWSGLVMAAAQALTLYVASLEKVYFESIQFTSPDLPVGPAIAYFFGVVIVLGLVLFFIPLNKLRLFFRILFAFMYGWGVLIIGVLTLPEFVAYAAAVIAGAVWLFWPRVWLHNLLLMTALSGSGSVFGFLFSPWTFMIFMLVIAVYDVLAVRFGFMIWMADKFSESSVLPAFVFPRRLADWRVSVQKMQVGELKDKEPEQREFSILGGGDIGFPLMLAVSVYFASGLADAVLVSAFAIIGLMGAYLIQLLWLKGKPVPALPPIALACLLGLVAGMWV